MLSSQRYALLDVAAGVKKGLMKLWGKATPERYAHQIARNTEEVNTFRETHKDLDAKISARATEKRKASQNRHQHTHRSKKRREEVELGVRDESGTVIPPPKRLADELRDTSDDRLAVKRARHDELAEATRPKPQIAADTPAIGST